MLEVLLPQKKALLEEMVKLHRQITEHLKKPDEIPLEKLAGAMSDLEKLQEQINELDAAINEQKKQVPGKIYAKIIAGKEEEIKGILAQIQAIQGQNVTLAKGLRDEISGKLKSLQEGRQAIAYLKKERMLNGNSLNRTF
ncbi:MAG: hypothetical protein AB1523_03885 [Bacillota bacterium]